MWLKDLFGILVVVNVYVVSRAMLENILDYENCNCRKKLFDKLVKECSESIDENELISVTLNDYESVCWSCTVYITLFVIAFLIMIGISSAFIYFHWYLK